MMWKCHERDLWFKPPYPLLIFRELGRISQSAP